jgi:hypothetical protein
MYEKFMKRLLVILISVLLLFFSKSESSGQDKVSIISDKVTGAPFSYGLTELMRVLQSKRIEYEKVNSLKETKGNLIIITGLSRGTGMAAQLLKEAGRKVPATAEALLIWKTRLKNKEAVVISGYDDKGIMYGLLDVADRIRGITGNVHPLSAVNEITEQPAIAERAVSMYTMNRRYWEDRLFDETYWTRYFDLLAHCRFNMFTIIFGYENGGFLAPCYPYFFDVEGYPGVKMSGLTQKEQQRNLTALNRVIQLAKDRGIGITLGIWDHIYRGGVQAGDFSGEVAHQQRNILVTGLDSGNLINYTGAALNKLIKVMPGLEAIQFRMHDESGLKKGEQRPFWKDLFQSIKKNHPDMRLVLRAKGLPDETIQDAVNSGLQFSISTKFWMEQTGLPYSPTHVYKQDQKNRRHGYADMLRYPQEYKIAWGLWTGGTNRILLWGDH